MIELIGPLYNLVHKSLSDWTLTSSDHTTPPTGLTALHCTDYTVRVTLRLTIYRQSLLIGDKPLETHGQ
jgi:hypothetical protein